MRSTISKGRPLQGKCMRRILADLFFYVRLPFCCLIVFLPFMVLYYLTAILNVILYWLWITFCTHSYVDKNGLQIKSRNKKLSQQIPWQDIECFEETYRPPFHTYSIVLKAGGRLAVNFLGKDFSLSELGNYDVRYVKKLPQDRPPQ